MRPPLYQMSGKRWTGVIIAALCTVVLWGTGMAAEKETLPQTALEVAAEQLLKLPLDSALVYGISQKEIEQKDMVLRLERGRLIPFSSLTLDGGKIQYGGIFIGTGYLQFHPSISMERQQLRRFMKTDSLNRRFETALLILDSTTFRALVTGSSSSEASGLDIGSVRNRLRSYLEESWDREFQFSGLRSLANPLKEPYMVALTDLVDGGAVLYQYDPYMREQVGFYKREMQVIYRKVWQPLCSYAVEADTVALDFGGVDKTSLQTMHHDLDLVLKRSGELRSIAQMTMQWDTLPARVFSFYLDAEMEVDSIRDSAGTRLPFFRFEKSDHYYGLWLLMEHPPSPGSGTTLQFYYHGDVARRELGVYLVFAGSDWYPHGGKWSPATFDIKMRSPSDYTLVASGDQVQSTKIKDTLFSHWRVSDPSEYASFNIGIFKRHQYQGKDGVALDVQFSEVLHHYSGGQLKQVVGDIQGSLEFYHWLYGPLRTDTVVVSEAIQSHSTSFPSFILLGAFTWIDTDLWGYERLHRSHETAHQWFGAGVGIETYRDTWLSEGFAEYSSYMYLQAVAGNKTFLDRMDEHREDILLERKNAAALALGPRAYTVKDEDNYDVVVYMRGAFVLHMLRNLMIDLQTMKEDRFYAMMRDFYATYNGKQASTHDFRKMVEKYTGVDMGWFFRQWVYNNYLPTYDFTYELIDNADGTWSAHLRVKQSEVPEDFRMYVQVEVEMEQGRKSYVRMLVDRPDAELQLKLPTKPKKIRLNPFLSVLAEVHQ